MNAFLVLSALVFFKLCIWTRDSKAKGRVRQPCFCCLHCCQNCPPNGEIWISFLLLSCMCAHMSVAEAERQDFFELREFLKRHEQDFKTSDATYYTPDYETIDEACFNEALLCYIVEVQVILYETKGNRSENVLEPMTDVIRSQKSGNYSCLPCEAFEETDSTTFLKSLHTFLMLFEDVQS